MCAGWGENNEGLVIAGGRVTASGKDYGTSGKLAFPQYSERILYAVGEKSGIDCETIDEEVIAYGSPELNADENSVNGTLSRVCTSVRLSDDESSTNFKNFYEYTTGNAAAKTVVARRNNERKLAITDLGAELSENAGCRLMLFAPVSTKENIILDGDSTLDLNGYDVTCGALIMQNGAGVFGKGNIPVGKIGAGGKLSGGTYGNLPTTDGKNICDHLIEDTFCIQKDDTDNNDKNVYWYDIAAVQSMANAVVRPISFKTDPVADVEAKAGEEIKVPIYFHETPYYEKSAYNIDGFILINEDGSETKLAYGYMSDNFTKLDKTTESWERYPVKDKTTTATLKYSMFPGIEAYKVCAVLSAYLGEKKVEYNGIIYNLSAEKYVTKTEPFEIRIGVSRPGYVMPEPAVDPDGNVVMAWNIYSQYTYTGFPQQLVHSAPQIFNGVMMYRFGEEDKWTEEIPTATEPGEYTFQNYIKGNDGYMDVPMDDGRAVINSAVLEDNSGSVLKDNKYFVRVSDALDEAVKKENEGKLLRLYYADKGGFALSGDTKIKLGLEHAATVGEISLAGAAQLEVEYGTVNKINLSRSAQLNVSGGTVKNLAATGKNARISGGTFENITALNGGLVSDLLADGYALQGTSGALVNMYTDKILQSVSVVPHTHDLGDIGTCACGYEVKAIDSDNDGFVEISTVEQLQWFAGQINSGKTLSAVLANDIDMGGKSAVIGTAANPFKGIFDGKGKTISNYALTVSDNKQGLFGVVNGGTVKNFSISCAITVDGNYTHIGGAVGIAKGGAVVSGIVSDVNISGAGVAKHVGGVLGYINNENFGGLKNSFSAGYSSGAALIGTVRKCSDSVKNCVYSEGAPPSIGSGAANHKAESVLDWRSGRAAYLLNGGLDNSYIWRQTLGKDAYPSFSGDRVYRNGKDTFTSEKPATFLFFDGSTVTAEQTDGACVLIVASYGGDRLIDVKKKEVTKSTAITLEEMGLNQKMRTAFAQCFGRVLKP